jgi:tetratricopeptide (TPR) repeat protein/predicted aspartyl protease
MRALQEVCAVHRLKFLIGRRQAVAFQAIQRIAARPWDPAPVPRTKSATNPRVSALAAWILLGTCFCSSAGADCKLTTIAEVPVTMNGMRPTIQAQFNGADVRLILDSGAFFSTISPAVASEFNLPLKSGHGLELVGAGGKVKTQVATVKMLRVFDIDIPNVDFVVGGSDVGGDVSGLLGQNLLRAGDVEYDLAHGAARIIRAAGCRRDEPLAYWASSQPLSSIDIEYATAGRPHTVGTATLNGTRLMVAFDTGANISIVTRAAAVLAGINLNAANVVRAAPILGIGVRAQASWIVPVASFKIGDEEIRNTHIVVADIGTMFDMLLGADFFLAHRMYVASSQRKLYFTYNGGPVFNLGQATSATANGHGPDGQAQPTSEQKTGSAAAAPGSTASTASAAGTAGDESSAASVAGIPAAEDHSLTAQSTQDHALSDSEPIDAAAFSRRGTAFAARGDFEHAIRDLSRAIELEPRESSYSYERGTVLLRSGKPDLALADFDRVLSLNASDVSALVSRARLRLAKNDDVGAAADLDVAASVAPRESETRLLLGDLYVRAGRYDAAALQFDQWIAAHHRDVGLATAMGERCWARALAGNDLNRAQDDCDAAITRFGDYPAALSGRAMIEYKRGNFDRAVRDWNSVVAKTPKEAFPLYARGVARLRKGMTSQGQADIAAATALSSTIQDLGSKLGVVPPH